MWKTRSVENAECGKRGVWKMWSVEDAECGKRGVWKMKHSNKIRFIFTQWLFVPDPYTDLYLLFIRESFYRLSSFRFSAVMYSIVLI